MGAHGHAANATPYQGEKGIAIVNIPTNPKGISFDLPNEGRSRIITRAKTEPGPEAAGRPNQLFDARNCSLRAYTGLKFKPIDGHFQRLKRYAQRHGPRDAPMA